MTGAGEQQKAGRAMDDHFRTSDADRDRAAALLRDHFAAGRLAAGELDERLTAALKAKTFGDLRRVLADLPEPEPAQQLPSRLPPDRGGLERGYRRLLACYPAAYRGVHEEEMLAVLMIAAPEGKRRPGMAEAADLIWGALRVRCQPSRNGTEPAWRDALAVLSVILPLIVFVTSALQTTWVLLFAPAAVSVHPLWVLNGFLTSLALLALALTRLHRLAALTAVALLTGLAVLAGLQYLRFEYATTFNPYILLAVGLQIVAVTASRGPRRGLQLLTWKHAVVTVAATATIAIIGFPLSLVVIPVICAAMALSSSLGRWLLVLLAIPAWPYIGTPLYASFATMQMRLGIAPLMRLDYALGQIGQSYLLPAVLLGLFVVAARRESRRSRQLTPPAA
jgi:hypothetical protein